MTGHGEESSLEQYQIMRASELYPKKATKADESGLQVPFPELCGESTEYIGKTTDGVIAASNYRLFVRFKDSFINVPLGLIESVEYRDIFFIYICCKDGHSFRTTFSTNEVCLEWYKRLCAAINPPAKLSDVFCFAFHAYWKDSLTEGPCAHNLCRMVEGQDGKGYSFDKEVERMGLINKQNDSWKITSINDEYKVCSSYPKYHIIPKTITEKEIEAAASFRGSKRFPSVVWRDRKSGSVICRSSQPEVGWLGWRSPQDEALIAAIAKACEQLSKTTTKENESPNPTDARKMLIVDARSYAAAVANRAKGGGCECIEYYPNCEIQFMSLANIHTIRKSFHAVRTLCSTAGDQPGWLQGLDTTKWLTNISSLLKAALTIVTAIDKECRPVLVHCSDGWDRTPQIVALAEIMLDPYYRTIEGFRVLVEREWLEYGHKFADRCGIGKCSEDTNERCPVFLQFLDCVHQLLVQAPLAFHFNDAYLVKLAQHTYSNLFGTFLCNNIHDREMGKVPEQTCSVWTLLSLKNRQYVNPLYIPQHDQVLQPSWYLKDLHLWRTMYMCKIAPSAALEESDEINVEMEDTLPPNEDIDKQILPKTRSCENLATSGEHSLTSGRRLSDPNIKADPNLLVNGHTANDSINVEEELAEESENRKNNIVINDDCVKFSNIQGTGSSDTLVPENSSPQKFDDASQTDENISISGSQKVQSDEAVVKDIETMAISRRADNSDCDTTPQCSIIDKQPCQSDDDHLNDETNVHLTNGDVLENEAKSIDAESVCKSKVKDIDATATADKGLGKEIGDCNINGSITVNDESENNYSVHTSHVDKSTSKLVDEENGKESDDVHTNLPTQTQQPNILQHYKAANMSTSTSDISDSHVNIDFKSRIGSRNRACGQHVDETLLGLDMGTVTLDKRSKRHLQVDLGVVPPVSLGSTGSRESSHGSTQSEAGSHIASAAASSTESPSPSSDKMSGYWPSKQLQGVTRYLDVDGLHIYDEPNHTRLLQITSIYQEHIRHLEEKLHTAKSLLYHYTSGKNGTGKALNDHDLLSGESEGEEHASLGGRSAASDISYELVGEDDAFMTLWVPDHAVTHCTGCDREFWIVRRRHHCRSCGKVYCGSCAPHYAPVPQQHLTNPVRVCRNCYSDLDFEPVEGYSSPDKEAQLGSAMEEDEEDCSTLLSVSTDNGPNERG